MSYLPVWSMPGSSSSTGSRPLSKCTPRYTAAPCVPRRGFPLAAPVGSDLPVYLLPYFLWSYLPQVGIYLQPWMYLHVPTTVPPTYMYLPPVAHVVSSSGIDTSLPIVACHDNLQPIIRRPSLSLHPTPLARTRARARMPCPVSACEARARSARDGRECKEGDVSHSR